MMMANHNHEGDSSEPCEKELQQLNLKNYNMSHEMECVKKELEQIAKELEGSKSLNDLQQKNFTEEIRKNLMQMSSIQMAALEQQLDHKNVLKLVEDLKGQNEQLNAKTIRLEKQLKSKQEVELENHQLQQKLDAMKHLEDEVLKMNDTKRSYLQLVVLEQQKADENVRKLAEAQQRLKDQNDVVTIQLQEQQDMNQKLELEILHLKGLLSELKHMEDDEVAEFLKKIDALKKDLREKWQSLEDLDALMVRKRKTDIELQQSRKEELIDFNKGLNVIQQKLK